MPIISLIKSLTGGGGDDKQKYVTDQGFDDLNKAKDDAFGADLARPNLGVNSITLGGRLGKRDIVPGYGYRKF